MSIPQARSEDPNDIRSLPKNLGNPLGKGLDVGSRIVPEDLTNPPKNGR